MTPLDVIAANVETYYSKYKKKKTKRHQTKKHPLFQTSLKIFIAILLLIIIWLLLLLRWPDFMISNAPWAFPKFLRPKPPQHLELHTSLLSITDGNQVDLSELYKAGEALELENLTFNLKELDITPGTYGSSVSIPVISVDKYGRITAIDTASIFIPSAIQSINGEWGPHIYIQGTPHQVLVETSNNQLTLKTPQDIHSQASPQFQNLKLTESLNVGTMIYDSTDQPGTTGQILTVDSTTGHIVWRDIGLLTSDDQLLFWNPTTFELTIENGNSVDLSSLAIWSQLPIGGYYRTDYVTPRSNNVQRIFLNYTGWGLTELQIRNDDNSQNYSGAVLSLKGSGPEYTNNMFFAKLGDNYYVPSWAGKGVVSTDQPLIIASVRSNDPAHPNNTPYIMFQTGGYYTAPVDRMILDHNGNLGIGDFAPDEKLTIAGNIHLTGSNPGKIYSRFIDLEITTEPSRFGAGDIIIHPGNFGGNTGMPKNVYIYAGVQQISPWSAQTGNVIMLANKNNDTIGHLLIGHTTDVTGQETLAQITINSDNNYTSNLYLIRYSDTSTNAPVLDFLRYRGDYTFRQPVQPDDITAAINSHALNTTGRIYQNASIFFDATSVTSTGVGGRIRFMVSTPNAQLQEAMRIHDTTQIGIGTNILNGQVSIEPTAHPIALNILSHNGTPGVLAFSDSTNTTQIVGLQAPINIADPYILTLPPQQGLAYEVMYNDGAGNLNWSSVNRLMAISVGDTAVLYSDGTNIVGNPDNLQWDYNTNRLGINMVKAARTAPSFTLHVAANSHYDGIVLESMAGNYPVIMAAAGCDANLWNCTKIAFNNGRIWGTYYTDVRWAIGRDEFGSALAGLRLNGRNGIWAGGYDIHLVARNYSALGIFALGSYRIVTHSLFNVGIATNNPTAKLQVGEAGDGTFALANSWQTFSDKNLKTDIKPLSTVLEKILQLNPVSYLWMGDQKNPDIGFIAQEVEKIFPELVRVTSTGLYTMDYSKMVVLAIQAIKELNEKIAALEQENAQLKVKIQQLETRLTNLEQKLGISPNLPPVVSPSPTPTNTPGQNNAPQQPPAQDPVTPSIAPTTPATTVTP